MRSSLSADRKTFFTVFFFLLLLFLFAKLKQLFVNGPRSTINPCGELFSSSGPARGPESGTGGKASVLLGVLFFFSFFFGREVGGGVVQVGGLTNIQGVRGNNSEVYKRILVHVHTGKSSQIQILLKQL